MSGNGSLSRPRLRDQLSCGANDDDDNNANDDNVNESERID